MNIDCLCFDVLCIPIIVIFDKFEATTCTIPIFNLERSRINLFIRLRSILFSSLFYKFLMLWNKVWEWQKTFELWRRIWQGKDNYISLSLNTQFINALITSNNVCNINKVRIWSEVSILRSCSRINHTLPSIDKVLSSNLSTIWILQAISKSLCISQTIGWYINFLAKSGCNFPFLSTRSKLLSEFPSAKAE